MSYITRKFLLNKRRSVCTRCSEVTVGRAFYTLSPQPTVAILKQQLRLCSSVALVRFKSSLCNVFTHIYIQFRPSWTKLITIRHNSSKILSSLFLLQFSSYICILFILLLSLRLLFFFFLTLSFISFPSLQFSSSIGFSLLISPST